MKHTSPIQNNKGLTHFIHIDFSGQFSMESLVQVMLADTELGDNLQTRQKLLDDLNNNTLTRPNTRCAALRDLETVSY